jgi:hypothetical protein
MKHPEFPLKQFVKSPEGYSLAGYFSPGRSKKGYPYYRFIPKKQNFNRDNFTKLFKRYLNSFSLNSELLERLTKHIKMSFKENTGNEIQDAETMENKLKEIKQQQTLLIQKNLKGFIGDQTLKEQLDMLDKEMDDINISLANFRETKVDIDELIVYTEEYLKNPGIVWQNADIDTKLKLQWFEFPQGIVFKNNNFQTAKVASIYKVKGIFQPPISSQVDSRIDFTNHIVNELVCLAKILKDKKQQSSSISHS